VATKKRRKSRFRRPKPTRFERVAVLCLAGASGILAGAAGTHATANRVSDFIVAAGLGVAVVAAGSISRTWTWLVGAGVVTALAVAPWNVFGGVAMAVGLVAAALPNDLPERRAFGGAVGLVVAQGLLRLDVDRFGRSALAAAVVVGVMAVSAYRAARTETRSRVRTGVVIGGALATLAVLGFLLVALQSKSAVEVGIKRSREGLAAARHGETNNAAQLLNQASRSFGSAHRDLSSWLARPVAVLPLVGQQARALQLLSGAGASVAKVASESAGVTNVEDLKVVDGTLDLDQVRSMAEPLASVVAALESASTDGARAESSWLLPPVADRLDTFTESIGDALHDGQTAKEAVAVLPALLGGEGTRHYMVCFATPSEQRDLGGFIGAYGQLVAENGKLDLVETGRIQDLNDRRQGLTITDPTVFPSRYLAWDVNDYWQNISATADFPTMAEAARQLWPQVIGDHLDGVLYVDPVTLAALLDLTGPVSVPGYEPKLSAAGAADFLLRGQYQEFLVGDDRHDFLLDASRTVFDKLTSGNLPGPRRIADTLAPAAHQRRLLLHSFHPEEQALFERLRLDGALPPVGTGDFLSVRSSNLGINKIDAFQERTIDYKATVNPSTGEIAATVTVEIANTAPAGGLPDYVIGNKFNLPLGTNSQVIAVYTPFDLTGVTQDGVSVGNGAFAENGRKVYTALTRIPAGQTVTLVFSLTGVLDVRNGYELLVVPQPTAVADQFHFEIDTASGWKAKSPPDSLPPELKEDLKVRIGFSRQ
jgi:hypothetical protein